MESNPLVHEGTIKIPRGTSFDVEGKTYRLSTDQNIGYIDHRGAGAKIIVTDPINKNVVYAFGPNLEGTKDEIQEAAFYVLNRHAIRLNSLRSTKNIRTPEKEDNENLRKELLGLSKELGILEGFLQAA